MNIEKLNPWFAFTANIGVIAGLVFLAVEIGQNQQSLERANTMSQLDASLVAVDLFNEFRSEQVENEEIAKIWLDGIEGKFENPVDEFRFMRLCANLVYTYMMSYEQYMQLDRMQVAEGLIKNAQLTFSRSPTMTECWLDEQPAIRRFGGIFEQFIDAVGISEP